MTTTPQPHEITAAEVRADTTPGMTTAEKIAARYSDGQIFKDERGADISAVCHDIGGAPSWLEGWHVGNTYRYDFEDGSGIVFAGEAWDLQPPDGGSDCYCWAGIGHDESCPDWAKSEHPDPITYRVTATDAQGVAQESAEVLGEAFGIRYGTREAAELAAARLAESLADFPSLAGMTYGTEPSE